MAKANDTKLAEELAQMCIADLRCSADMLDDLCEFNSREIDIDGLNKRFRKLRRKHTGVHDGVAKSTGQIANDILYSHFSKDVFSYNVPVYWVQAHAEAVSSNTMRPYVGEVPKPKEGDLFVVTSGHDFQDTFSIGSVVKLVGDPDNSSPLYNLVHGSCKYRNGNDLDMDNYGAYMSLNFRKPYNAWFDSEPVAEQTKSVHKPLDNNHKFKVGNKYLVIDSNGFVDKGEIVELDYFSGDSHYYTWGNDGAYILHKRLAVYDDSSSQPAEAQAEAETLNVTKEVPMNPNDVISTKTLVFGVDTASLSEDQLFDQVARVDAEIDRLEACKTQPKVMVARIAKMKEQLKALVEFIDAK